MTDSTTKAIILAAGTGSRLRPYTDDRTKVMVELFGQPILDYQLDVLKEHGIDDVTIVTGHAPDSIPDGPYRKVHNERYAESNMVESLFMARDVLRAKGDVVVAYGDIVFESVVLEAVLEKDAPITVAVDRKWHRYWSLRMDDPLDDAETLKLEQGDRIVELGKTPSSPNEIEGQYTGLIRFREDLAQRLPDIYDQMDRDATYDGEPFSNLYMTAFLQYLIDNGREVRAAFIENGWLEVDTCEDLELYHELEKNGNLSSYFEAA